MASYAKVCLLDAPISLDKPFDYLIPEQFCDIVRTGSLVYVPFSNANKKRMGIVMGLSDSTESVKTKEIIDIHRTISLGKDGMELCDFLKKYTLCSTGDAVRTITPPLSALSSARETYELFARKTKLDVKISGSKQKALYDALSEDFQNLSEIFKATSSNKTQLLALEKLGVIEIEKRKAWKNPYANIKIDKTKQNLLSQHQNKAYEKLCDLYGDSQAKCALLYGVTGSGKTRVMKECIDHVVASGKSVIVLVPEIPLTPQTVSLFCSFYGERVAVLHSSLSAGERYDAYRRISEGNIDLVIGTRSAVFAPLPNLGMIIIDEEQEHTYKSDMSPKYHARDVAAFRVGKCKGLLILASATPTVESYYKAKSGIYTLVELTERYGSARLPQVYIDDMRLNMAGGNMSPIGNLLSEKLAETIKMGNQAILFLNRRGYNSFLSCRDCGDVVLCPHCSISLTRHKSHSSDYLLCHMCGYKSPLPDTCPSCGSSHMAFMGFGTQKVEEEFSEKFSGKLMRMDADTTTQKSSYDRLLSDFRSHSADVLLGTQMVAKGHDFPNVTLVGVLNADASLYLDDFRAGERTFSMLTQVIGRAGRAEKRGIAIIQTHNPKNEIIKLAAEQNYKAFYERDIKIRSAFTFPPYCDIALVSITSRDEVACLKCASAIFGDIKSMIDGEYSDLPVVSFGPFEASVYKVDERFRMKVVLKCRRSSRLLEMFSQIIKKYTTPAYKNISISFDINPTNV